MATLELQGLRKSFGTTQVLRQIDLSLIDGEMLVVTVSGAPKDSSIGCTS